MSMDEDTKELMRRAEAWMAKWYQTPLPYENVREVYTFSTPDDPPTPDADRMLREALGEE